VNILLVQDSDWLVRGPHQQHHLMERLALKQHKIHVIDYEILWRTHGRKMLYSKRQVFDNVSRIYKGAKITVIRPSIVKIPWLDYVSLIFAQRKEIHQQIKEFSPDVIIGLGILSSYSAMKAAKRNDIPFIYYWIDLLHRLISFKPFQPVAKILESKALRQADRVLAINEQLRRCLVRMGASPERTEVLRAGIDVERFNPTYNGSAIREQYGFKENDIVLFFMGWLYHFSGLKEVVARLAETKDNNLKLLIVGEGDAYDELQQIRYKYDLQDRVVLTGKKPYQEIPSFIAAADVCLLPAYPTEKIMQDIVPIKIYEYMAMAKPVISTRLPGIVREFGEGNGVVYINRPEDVITKAIRLIQDSSLKQLGTKARNFVERNSWHNITVQLEKILDEVVKGRISSGA